MNALEMAIKMKTDAIRYYGEVIEKCGHPGGRKMFEVMLEDEKEHLKHLEQITQDMQVDVRKFSPIENIKTALHGIKDEMTEVTACSLDDMEAFKIAMDMEKRCVEFYAKQAKEGESDAERALFEKLAHEEQEHFKVLSNTHSFLSDSGNWFMWDDHSIVEG